jgi:coenzyme F420-reducing hydrogenase beta subunit
VHARRTEDIGLDVHDIDVVGVDVPNSAPGGMVIDTGIVALSLVENVYFLSVTDKHLEKKKSASGGMVTTIMKKEIELTIIAET